MKTSMKNAAKRVLVPSLAVVMLAACAHEHPDYEDSHSAAAVHRASPVHHGHAGGDDSVNRARRMCAIATLAEQRQAMLEEVHRYRESIRAGASSGANVADTRTQEIIAVFETDLDASYRFATSSCRTYNRCLEENSFAEAACQDTAALWHDGQGRFHDLSVTLADVRERVAMGCSDCSAPRSHDRTRRLGREGYTDRRRQSDETIGSVFSTDGH